MTRLNQILAVVGGVTSAVKTQLAELEHVLTVKDGALTAGLEKTYKPRAEPQPGDPPPLIRPRESQKVQVTVDDVLAKARRLLTRKLDVTRTLDESKALARADVIVDGEPLLRGVNTDHLVYLGNELRDLTDFIAKLPVLDPGETWITEGCVEGQHKTLPAETTSNDKVYFNHELSPAQVIDGHPFEPKIELLTRQEVVGFWSTVKYSGAMDAGRKRQLLDRLEQLREAVKAAREEANTMEVTDTREGEVIFGWLLRP